MRALLLLLLLLPALGGCSGNHCRASRDCEPGQHCDFPTGECLDGCMGPSDCSPVAFCQVSSGRCLPTDFQFPDAGTSSTADAGTSSTADAG